MKVKKAKRTEPNEETGPYTLSPAVFRSVVFLTIGFFTPFSSLQFTSPGMRFQWFRKCNELEHIGEDDSGEGR